MDHLRSAWLALVSLMLATAHAEDAPRHSAALSVQGDDNGNRQWFGKLGGSLGEHAWLQGSAGGSELDLASSKLLGAALGIQGESLNAVVEFSKRSGDERFEQQSWAALLEWRGVRGGIGADASRRSAHGKSTMIQPGGAFVPPSTITVRETVKGTGLGLHGDFALTRQATVFAGAMRYRYDFHRRSEGASSTSALSPLLGTSSALAGAWREQALIERSYRIGGSYVLQGATVGAQYFWDRAAHTDEAVSTIQLQADIPFAGRWLVSPSLARSSGGSIGDVAYAGLSLRVNW